MWLPCHTGHAVGATTALVTDVAARRVLQPRQRRRRRHSRCRTATTLSWRMELPLPPLLLLQTTPSRTGRPSRSVDLVIRPLPTTTTTPRQQSIDMFILRDLTTWRSLAAGFSAIARHAVCRCSSSFIRPSILFLKLQHRLIPAPALISFPLLYAARRVFLENGIPVFRYGKTLCLSCMQLTERALPQTGFPRLLEIPGFFFLKIPGPGKSWKITLVLEIKA